MRSIRAAKAVQQSERLARGWLHGETYEDGNDSE
jgi:hypothetical protein